MLSYAMRAGFQRLRWSALAKFVMGDENASPKTPHGAYSFPLAASIMKQNYQHTQEQIKFELDKIEKLHFGVRDAFRYVKKSEVGKDSLNMRVKRFSIPFNLTMKFEKPIDIKTVEEVNELSHFMNQNVIIRIYALLDYYQIVNEQNKIKKHLEGWRHVDLLRRLRTQFAHTSGRYNEENPVEKRLYDTLIKTYNLESDLWNKEEYPLLKNKVIKNMIKGIKKYIDNYFKEFI